METLLDNAGDNTYLFITDSEHNQWRVLLEKKSTGYTWCGVPNGGAAATTASASKARSRSPLPPPPSQANTTRRSSSHTDIDSSTGGDSESEMATPMRSRFGAIRNMSVASLASLRQKLSEGRKMLDRKVNASSAAGLGDGVGSEGQGATHSSNMVGSLPEPLNKKVGATRLFVQQQNEKFKRQPVLGGLFPGTDCDIME